MDVKQIVKKRYDQLYAHKFDNLDELDKFLEKKLLPKLTQGELDNLNRFLSIKEIKSQLINFPNRKPQAQRVHWSILPNI